MKIVVFTVCAALASASDFRVDARPRHTELSIIRFLCSLLRKYESSNDKKKRKLLQGESWRTCE